MNYLFYARLLPILSRYFDPVLHKKYAKLLVLAFLCMPIFSHATNQCEVSIGWVDFSVENIIDNNDGTVDFCFKVRNGYRHGLKNVSFELPGVTAISPANNSTYYCGKTYSVKNPNYSPFYSIKFTTMSYRGIRYGQADYFCYTLPAADAYSLTSIQVRAKIGNYACSTTLDISNCLFSRLGNKVWEDLNQDGLQDMDEPGVPGVDVKLYDCDDNFIAQKTTNSSGRYIFKDLIPGSYYVAFSNLPANFDFTTQDVGNKEWRDSDAGTDGKTACVSLDPGERYRKVDAGLVLGCAITDGGTVGPDRFGCGPYDPDVINSVTLPEGGNGQFEYVWLYSLDPSLPFEMWVEEPNSNSESYDPHFIDKTCWLVRCAKRVGCTDPTAVAYSNIVVAQVDLFPLAAFDAPGGVCNAASTTLSAQTADGSAVSYSWTFQDGIPATATGQNADVYWGVAGTYNITLTVESNSCVSTLTKPITIDDCGVCDNVKNAGSIEGGDVSCMVPFDPDPIVNKNFPNPGTGTGPLEYVWLSSPDINRPQNQWDIVPGGNSPDLDPGPIDSTMHYLRCVRRAGCDSYKETNVITIEIVENAESLCKPKEYDASGFVIELDLTEGTTTGRYVLSQDERKFVTYTDGTASLTGRMIHTENENRRWIATFWFENKSDYGQWTATGGNYEMGNYDDLRFTWDYYTLDASRSVLIGKNKFNNKTLNLAPYSATDGFQYGEGANTETEDLGAFGRFSYTGDYTGNGVLKMGFEDCTEVCQPEAKCAIHVVLQGCYNSSTGKMHTLLRQSGNFPTTQPFNVAPWNYAGTESVDLTTLPMNIVTWVHIEVRDQADSTEVITEIAALVDEDGLVRGLDGVSLPEVSVPAGTDCFFVVEAYGHLSAMCKRPVRRRKGGRCYRQDFRDITKVHHMTNRPGSPMCNVSGQRYGLWCGNAAGGQNVNSVDLHTVLNNLNYSGFHRGDVNCDGSINNNDVNITQSSYFRSNHCPRRKW